MRCTICPHNCSTNRTTDFGVCQMPAESVVAKVMLHRFEEPPISGERGSGAIFFSGCNLKCVYCQNYQISQQHAGRQITAERLTRLFFKLAEAGAHNISLITPMHFIQPIAAAIALAKKQGFSLPFVYNTNSYERVESLKTLNGLIDIYLPDIKYCSNEAALKYSRAPNYFAIASDAVLEMARQTGANIYAKNGMLQSGLIIRHLVLPGLRHDSFLILNWIAANLPHAAISLMAQYIPAYRSVDFKELNRRVTTFEYQSVVEHAVKLKLTNGFTQQREAATAAYTPDFTLPF